MRGKSFGGGGGGGGAPLGGRGAPTLAPAAELVDVVVVAGCVSHADGSATFDRERFGSLGWSSATYGEKAASGGGGVSSAVRSMVTTGVSGGRATEVALGVCALGDVSNGPKGSS